MFFVRVNILNADAGLEKPVHSAQIFQLKDRFIKAVVSVRPELSK